MVLVWKVHLVPWVDSFKLFYELPNLQGLFTMSFLSLREKQTVDVMSLLIKSMILMVRNKQVAKIFMWNNEKLMKSGIASSHHFFIF